jgi:hypothetical protein
MARFVNCRQGGVLSALIDNRQLLDVREDAELGSMV